MRKITVFNTSNQNTQEIETSATTYGEIKDQIGANGQKAVVRSTKQTLDLADATLPEGDFTIFLFPEKVKSGLDADDYSDTPAGVKEMIADMDSNAATRQRQLIVELASIKSMLMGGTTSPSPKNDLAEEASKLGKEFGFGW